MLISWNWLSDYVRRTDTVEEATEKWTLSGLNLEEFEAVSPREGVEDVRIDLEVTSNRPDCLGHLGVARELAVLTGRGAGGVCKSNADVPTNGEEARTVTSVDINCPELCPQYTARVVKGVSVGPSPDWMADRLRAVGVEPVNNVVDCTNYVMLECGQPLHAFDFAKLGGGRIFVRRAKPGEKLEAINHKTYEMTPDDCVIADATKAVAIAGVMGGAETEIGAATADVLVEVANFEPLSVRNTARRLACFSDSSYRFERGVDEHQMDWASRRCCELIVQTAGGEVCDGVVMAGKLPGWDPEPITLRFGQIERLLGIAISADRSVEILESLGLTTVERGEDAASFTPPSWRRDLTRECDLIEEVGRIHGYDHVPTDAYLTAAVALPSSEERVIDRATDVLVGAGFSEAMTLSFVSRPVADVFGPVLGEAAGVSVEHSSRKLENVLRPSLIPSLLVSRRENERRGQFEADLFEIARVYLAAEADNASQPKRLSAVTGRGFREVRGVLDAVVRAVCREDRIRVRPCDRPEFAAGRAAELLLGETPWGVLGELSRETCDKLDLQGPATVFEVALRPLVDHARHTPRAVELPLYPSVDRDVNLMLDESVRWEDLSAVVRENAGPLLESVRFADQYRGKQIEAGKKSLVFSLVYRAADRTLTGEEIDAVQEKVVAACEREFGAVQR